MEKKPCFEISHSGYAVYRLYPEDASLLQRLFDQCADYFLMIDGEEVSSTAAQGFFDFSAPGKSAADKSIFGLINSQREIAGVLEATADYPENNIWWIGLLLIAPEIRGLGIGRKFLESFSKYVRSNNGIVIMGGVVENNDLARKFWLREGFQLVRKTEPSQFGRKMQAVLVMRRGAILYDTT